MAMFSRLFFYSFLSLNLLACTTRQKDNTASTDTLPFTSYFTGNSKDLKVKPSFGITMMGGRSEHDEAMKWFLQKANGGDILILRASGSDGYNDYLFSSLGVDVNSVESLVIKTPEAANHPYVLDKIEKAEAIWMAGGNQYNYVSIWGNSPMKKALNAHINQKKGAIGGTSAGMAVLGEWYYSAAEGSVKAEEALMDPFHPFVTLDNDFLQIPILKNTITDTHYAERNRQGRHTSFMARIAYTTEEQVFGIACDEYVAVCIGSDGIAQVYGRSPEKTHAAYFIQTNCTNVKPERLEQEMPLTWNKTQKALDVYRIIADSTGNQTFDLNDWRTGKGGDWLNWFVEEGEWFEIAGEAPNCN
jgi:cyanophycinase-like exopeptidase